MNSVAERGRCIYRGTQAAPKMPIDWCDSDAPITPYEISAVKMETSAAPDEAATATIFAVCLIHCALSLAVLRIFSIDKWTGIG
jgi:hypothetical protein